MANTQSKNYEEVRIPFTKMTFTPDVPSAALGPNEYNDGLNVESDVRGIMVLPLIGITSLQVVCQSQAMHKTQTSLKLGTVLYHSLMIVLVLPCSCQMNQVPFLFNIQI